MSKRMEGPRWGWIVLTIWGIFSFLPILFFASIALRPRNEIIAPVPIYFPTITIETWAKIWNEWPIGLYFYNSIVAVSGSVFICLILGVPAAYALARYKFRGNADIGNYILSTMESEGRDFAEVLAEAQALGYAEADPSFDIDGVDAAHKLSILASLAFGTAIDFEGVDIRGIRHVIAADIVEAESLGHRIRLVGMASAGNGLLQRVQPCLVPLAHPLAHVTGSLNAVVAEGNFVGRLFLQGRGAGEGPTASAVVADLIDIARGETGPAFAMPVASLARTDRAPAGESTARTYLRFIVADRPGVLAEITAAMRDADVSIESLSQRGVTAEGAAVVAIVTHECREANVVKALGLLEGSSSLQAAPMVMPILEV